MSTTISDQAIEQVRNVMAENERLRTQLEMEKPAFDTFSQYNAEIDCLRIDRDGWKKLAVKRLARADQLRTQLEAVRKVIDDRLSHYAEIENNPKGGLTEVGRHGKLVVENIKRDIDAALQENQG